MKDKRAARMHLRAARARRGPAELNEAAAALARHGLLAVGAARTVAAYASVADEPPTGTLLDELHRRGVRVLLPRVAGDNLEWAPYTSWRHLTGTAHGLLEPTGPALPDPLGEVVDLVLAPALAVDRHGNRLGRGAGYYDRALREVPTERIVAVVFDDEIVTELPSEQHDIPVAAALTPSGLVALGPLRADQ